MCVCVTERTHSSQTGQMYFCVRLWVRLSERSPSSLGVFPSPQNGNPQNPYCSGIEGVMESYYESLKSVQLYGPTNFSPVINHVAR